jgi:hypothetical protein
MDRALGGGAPFRIDPPAMKTGPSGAAVIEVAFHSGELGFPKLGLDARAVVAVDLDASLPDAEEAIRRRAARIVSGVARRAASAIAAAEARGLVQPPDVDGEVCRVSFAYDELADALARRVSVTLELLVEPDEPDDAVSARAAGPASALLNRMAEAVHDAVDDPAWAPVFGEGQQTRAG